MATSPDLVTGADGQPFVPIEEKHGEDCTCRAVGRIEFDLVAASRTCPGDRNPHRAGTVTAQLERFEPPYYPGHGIVITWPAPTGNSTPLMTQLMQVHDTETGEPLLAVTGLRMALGGDEWDGGPMTVDLKMYVDADGQPLIGTPANVVPDPDDPERFYSRVFRCYVTETRTRDASPHEMHLANWDGPIERLDLRYKPGAEVGADWGPRIAEAAKAIVNGDPGIPTRESVNRGEHTVNEYRAHHGIDGACPDLTKYNVDRTLGGTTLLRHAVDGCDRDEVVADADDDSLGTLVNLATRHHVAHHGIDGARPDLAIIDEVQDFGSLDDPENPTVRLRRGADGHIHQFPAKVPLTVPHEYAPCECGETLGGGHDGGPKTRRS